MIWLTLFLAIILRLIKIDQSLWFDEAINVVSSQNFSFWDFVTKYPIGDFHPPGYFALLWIWTAVGGTSEIWVRLPSVFFGVATVWLVYLLGKELFNRKTGTLAALLLAIAPLHVYYSQEARMYSLACFSATLSFYFFWRLVSKEDKGNLGNSVGYGVSNILVFYSDYLVYLIYPVQLFYLVLWQKNALKKIISPWVLSILILIPWLSIFPKQLSSGAAAASELSGWANVVGGATVKELLLIPVKFFFGRISIDNNQIYAVAVGSVGLLYGVIILQSLRKLDEATKLLLCWIFIPVTLAFLISFFIPVLSYFRMLFILPAFYLLIAKGFDALRTQAWPGRLVLSTVCMVSIVSLSTYYTNPKFQREDWKGAVNVVDEIAKIDGIILFENDNLPAPFIYYSKNLTPAMGGLRKVPAQSDGDILEIPGTESIYLFEYLVDITDPERFLEKKIESSGFKKMETLNFNGVGLVHHYKLK